MENELSLTKEIPSSLGKTWTHTRVNVLEASHIWRISNFSFICQHPFPYLTSENFSAAVNDKIKWTLRLNVNSKDKSVDMTLSLQTYQAEARAKYRLIIYDGTMKEAKVVSKSHFFTNNSSHISEVMCCQEDLVSADLKILSNDELTVGCEIKFVNSIDKIAGPNCNPEFMSKPHCFNNLELMFKNQEMSDVKINIGSRTFEAHKAILAAASPVFLAMFKSTMTEAEQNSINIDDMEEEIFEEMLRFIYTGNVNNIENVAYSLFSAADKYAIDELKHICQNQLYKSLTAANAINILILADLHNADWLKTRVIKFIRLQVKAVTETEDFKSMIDSHGHLLAKMIRAFAVE